MDETGHISVLSGGRLVTDCLSNDTRPYGLQCAAEDDHGNNNNEPQGQILTLLWTDTL